MERLNAVFDAAKRIYDRGDNPLDQIQATAAIALTLLRTATPLPFGTCAGKNYSVLEHGQSRSRPYLPTLLLPPEDFNHAWDQLVRSSNPRLHRFEVSELHAAQVIYSCVVGFALCYDLWKPKSRKTPGTFLEVVLGSLLAVLAPEAQRGKFIALRHSAIVEMPQDEIVATREVEAVLADDEEGQVTAGSVSTDIVFEFINEGVRRGIVIPAKITTRERIVQPFAHQRILDSYFGEGRYVSLLACVSETQRDDKRSRVNEICVPGTIELFQRHLAKIGGIFYLDPPERYLALSAEGIVRVRSVGALMTGEFDEDVRRLQTNPPDRR